MSDHCVTAACQRISRTIVAIANLPIGFSMPRHGWSFGAGWTCGKRQLGIDRKQTDSFQTSPP